MNGWLADSAVADWQLCQVPVDVHRFINAMHVPEGAGEHEADLVRMLLRIPDGWGRRVLRFSSHWSSHGNRTRQPWSRAA
jgi:hypothetical protein